MHGWPTDQTTRPRLKATLTPTMPGTRIIKSRHQGMIHIWPWCHIMEVEATEVHGSVYHRGRVHSSIGSNKGSRLDTPTSSWLLGEKTTRPSSTTIYCDSQSAIYLIQNPVYDAKMNHIEVRYHHIRELVTEKKLKVRKIDTEVNIVDCMTKPLPEERFKALRTSMGIQQMTA